MAKTMVTRSYFCVLRFYRCGGMGGVCCRRVCGWGGVVLVYVSNALTAYSEVRKPIASRGNSSIGKQGLNKHFPGASRLRRPKTILKLRRSPCLSV